MLLEADKAIERLSSDKNLANRFNKAKVTELGRPGKNANTVAMSPEVATTIAILSRSGENQSKVGALFGVTQERVSQIKTGAHATKVDEQVVERKLGQVRDIALDKLTDALMGISKDKLEATDAKGLSGIAANMSKVVDNLKERDLGQQGAQVQVHIYAPETKPERLYPTIEV